MGGTKSPVLGIDVPANTSPTDDPLLPGTGTAGTIGIDEPEALAASTVAAVIKDWEPTPSPKTTPEIVVTGKTLEEVGRQLNRLPEWGQAGGALRNDPTSGNNATVNLHGHLVYRLPRWTNYDSASGAVQQEWNKMFRKLTAHEDRHLEIAIEEGNQLAADLIGVDVSKVASMVTAANGRMAQRQKQLDDDTDHGAKAGVQYGDVVLDTSIT